VLRIVKADVLTVDEDVLLERRDRFVMLLFCPGDLSLLLVLLLLLLPEVAEGEKQTLILELDRSDN
jgi:hypothetical protein